MKHTVKIIFGKEEANKFYNNDSFTELEKQTNVKDFFFNTEAEKAAFISGINEAVGWIECLVVDDVLSICK